MDCIIRHFTGPTLYIRLGYQLLGCMLQDGWSQEWDSGPEHRSVIIKRDVSSLQGTHIVDCSLQFAETRVTGCFPAVFGNSFVSTISGHASCNGMPVARVAKGRFGHPILGVQWHPEFTDGTLGLRSLLHHLAPHPRGKQSFQGQEFLDPTNHGSGIRLVFILMPMSHHPILHYAVLDYTILQYTTL